MAVERATFVIGETRFIIKPNNVCEIAAEIGTRLGRCAPVTTIGFGISGYFGASENGESLELWNSGPLYR